MATTVNNTGGGGSGMNSLVGIVLILVIALLVIFYGLPMLQGGSTGGSGTAAPNVNINPK